jgi:hypothetical protein
LLDGQLRQKAVLRLGFSVSARAPTCQYLRNRRAGFSLSSSAFQFARRWRRGYATLPPRSYSQISRCRSNDSLVGAVSHSMPVGLSCCHHTDRSSIDLPIMNGEVIHTLFTDAFLRICAAELSVRGFSPSLPRNEKSETRNVHDLF